MSKLNHDKIIPRSRIVAVIFTLLGLAIIGKATYIMTAKKDYWFAVASRLKVDSLGIEPMRGNIFSCDGQLLASSLPKYRVCMDFGVHTEETDSIWLAQLDSICEGLHEIFPSKSAKHFKDHLNKGRKLGRRSWAIWPHRVDYHTYVKVRQLPVLNMPPNRGGFHTEEIPSRTRPFGSLAKRTIGAVYESSGKPYCGLEMQYDSVLRGKMGYVNRRKVLNRFTNIPMSEAVNGSDIVTTIDVRIQDIAERALIDMMEKEKEQRNMGVAIVLEVATGDIKAMVNLERDDSDGQLKEIHNNAISYRCEPGSVFKTASVLVALDDGVADTSDIIHTGKGVLTMYTRRMRDHNWNRGGYGSINLARALEVSSNIGIGKRIDDIYARTPEKYVEGLYRVGMAEDLQLDIPGYLKPKIRMPQRLPNGRFTDDWYGSALPWMSIGYETEVAPINTVAFYNAIANNGKMMRPRIVKCFMRDGQVEQEFPPVVLKEQIARPEAIATIRTTLEHVVSQGLGKKAGSRMFKVAGKTGTAQISQGASGYRNGVTNYWLSFCGYFPADNPQYTCIVCIRQRGGVASGGGTSGVVFHHIAEGIMSRSIKMGVEDSHDNTSVMVPDVKAGNLSAAEDVLTDLNLPTVINWDDYATVDDVWGTAKQDTKNVTLTRTEEESEGMPDLTGMGARDALYMVESRGMKGRVVGSGKVKRQSIKPGTTIVADTLCVIELG